MQNKFYVGKVTCYRKYCQLYEKLNTIDTIYEKTHFIIPKTSFFVGI